MRFRLAEESQESITENMKQVINKIRKKSPENGDQSVHTENGREKKKIRKKRLTRKKKEGRKSR